MFSRGLAWQETRPKQQQQKVGVGSRLENGKEDWVSKETRVKLVGRTVGTRLVNYDNGAPRIVGDAQQEGTMAAGAHGGIYTCIDPAQQASLEDGT